MSRVPLAGGHRQQVLAALTAAAMLVLIAVIFAVVAGRPGTVAASPPAPAAGPAGGGSSPAALPVVYSRVAGWHDGQVRPAVIYVGEGGAPYVNALSWPGWTVAGARADGELHMQKPGCALPAYQCPYQRVGVKVQLSRVESRHGVRYYARMRWTYTEDHVRHVIHWTISGGYWEPSGIPVGRAAVVARPGNGRPARVTSSGLARGPLTRAGPHGRVAAAARAPVRVPAVPGRPGSAARRPGRACRGTGRRG